MFIKIKKIKRHWWCPFIFKNIQFEVYKNEEEYKKGVNYSITHIRRNELYEINDGVIYWHALPLMGVNIPMPKIKK